MLQAYIPDATPLDCDDYYIKELPTGIDELVFNISIWADAYRGMTEETLIEDREGDEVTQYRIKAIDGGDKTAQIKALLVLDDWKQTVKVDYTITGTILSNVQAVLPDGWTVVDKSGMTGTAQSTEIPGGTPLDLLQEFRTAFDGASYRFNQASKTVTIWDLYNGPNLGTFMTRELNLHDVQYKGKSTNFVTRLYAYGKDGLSIADVNGGLPYVDNFTYSDRIVCGFWQDTRFEIASNLKEAAIAHLAEIAVPDRSFNCSVADLAAIDPERYSYLSFELFSQVGLIDETRGDKKIMHRVVERWRYPNYPEKNNIVLSNSPHRIQVQVVQALHGPINGNRLEMGSVGSLRLGGGAVLNSKLANGAVTESKLHDDSVSVNKIVNGAITTIKIRDDAVTGIKVLDQAISYAKLDEQLQIFYTDILAANAIYSGFLHADGSISCSVMSASNYIGVRGTVYMPGSYTVYDHNTTYSASNTQHSANRNVYDGDNNWIGYTTDYWYTASVSGSTNTVTNYLATLIPFDA